VKLQMCQVLLQQNLTIRGWEFIFETWDHCQKRGVDLIASWHWSASVSNKVANASGALRTFTASRSQRSHRLFPV
jgi:hypothetical protein